MSETDESSSTSQTVARLESLLSAVLDEIIPASPDGRLPGAGEVGLAGTIRELGDEDPRLASALQDGLASLTTLLAGRGSDDLEALPKEARNEVMRELAEAQPGFLPSLIFHTYARYYQQGRVMEAIGLPPRPPFPGGYEMEPNDFSLLDAVRTRGKRYRDC